MLGTGRLYLSPPHLSGLERELVADAFDSNWIAPLGPHVTAFEAEMCKKLGAGYATALSSGTAALHLALLLLGVGPGDLVVCSTLTFAASANPIRYLGATPVFVDSEPGTWNMSPTLLAEALDTLAREGTPAKAVIVVDLYGQCADWNPILACCARHAVPVIEDAAEALGATYDGRPAGTFGELAVLSFNGNKIITTSGGGMLLTPTARYAERALHLATQARDPAPHYQHSELGFNYRMSNVLAAIGRGQLRLLDERVRARRHNFEFYARELGGIAGIEFMPEAKTGTSNRWLTCLTVDPELCGVDREQIRTHLEALGIESRPVWKPMHLQPVYASCRVFGGACAERIFARGLCLPSGSAMTDADRARVREAIFTVPGLRGVPGLRPVWPVAEEQTNRDKSQGPTASPLRRTLLIGAGSAGVLVAKAVAQNPGLGLDIVGFIDDDPSKFGTRVLGHEVLGPSDLLPALVSRHCVQQAVITIASAPGPTIRALVERCEAARLPVQIIPDIHEILSGRVTVSRIRDVTVEDLLGREAVELDKAAIGRLLAGKRVLITGAGGSIGSELCRQVASFSPEQLVLFEQAENSLFYIHMDLQHRWPNLATVPYVADVADPTRVEQVFAQYRPQIVFHAAARKHVPMMELNPSEAVQTNVFGTRCVAQAADRHGAEAFVLISTDKAVNPTSVMGAAKRVAELVLQELSQRSRTRFAAVRFGNVLGSTGSVLPTFRAQIERGGPVTVTHPEMQRYFMTIPEACQLVMQAASMGEGGEIFVLDMGKPVRILELARELIRRSGFSEQEIPIRFTGLRPGEKLSEELSITSENITRTRHPKIFIGKIAACPPAQLAAALQGLAAVMSASSAAPIRAALAQAVPEMQDWDASQRRPGLKP